MKPVKSLTPRRKEIVGFCEVGPGFIRTRWPGVVSAGGLCRLFPATSEQEGQGSAVPSHEERYKVALEEARCGLQEGGIPIGGALYMGDELIATGRNRRVQEDSPIIHGEIDVFRAAGRPRASWYGSLVLYTTLSPCYMCAGASCIYGVTTLVIGENQNFSESEDLLKSRGINVIVLNDLETLEMFTDWTSSHQDLWFEDIPDPRRQT